MCCIHVQGGLSVERRRYCIEQMRERDLPGYAVGGLSGGEDKRHFYTIMHACGTHLPVDRPRYGLRSWARHTVVLVVE